MTIVDKPFASELVTVKGKAYKFDSIECLAQFVQESDKSEHALLLVRDFNSPDDWINAENAFFLISKSIPSPMGGYLSAFATLDAAKSMRHKMGGEIFSWNEVLEKYQP